MSGGAKSLRGDILKRAIPWIVTLACFTYLYFRIDGAAQREGSSAIPYLANVFANVSWARWLGLMVPYSIFFFLIDSLVVWRVIESQQQKCC